MTRKCWHEAPFEKNGDMSSYTGWRSELTPVEPFADTLTFSHFTRGRSSALAIFKRADGREVPVFLTDMSEMMQVLTRGKITSRFVYCKRGENYGVKLEEGSA